MVDSNIAFGTIYKGALYKSLVLLLSEYIV
jgi:hypothetical protein